MDKNRERLPKLYTKKEDCCGCTACHAACPVEAIAMKSDEEGFFYPVMKEELCIGCRRCETSCPIKKELHGNSSMDRPIAFAAVNKDGTVRRESSSGGVFTLFAKYILMENGIVFGAAMSADCEKVIHIAIESEDNLHILRGSKYVESDIRDSYICVKTELEKNRKVLFSGTPCQTAGLKAYLKKDYENLYTIEVICHGVPSSSLWRKYLSFIRKKIGGSITWVNFRYKTSQKLGGVDY